MDYLNGTTKLCNITKLKSFALIHDGKMHDGKFCDVHQKRKIARMLMSTNLSKRVCKQLVNENYNIDKTFYIAQHRLINYAKIQHIPQYRIPRC